jgi:hypothetical protein
LAVTDFEIAEKQIKDTLGGHDYSFKSKGPAAKILFGTSVNDKASFEKLITMLQGKLQEESPVIMGMAAKIPYRLTDNWFLAGDSGLVNTFGATSTNHAFISRISGHPMGGFIDIQKFAGNIQSLMGSSSEQVADSAVKFWQDIIFYGGEYKKGAVESHFEINLVDKTTNSLKQLNTYLGGLAKAQWDKREKQREAFRQWDTMPSQDSVVTTP